MELSLWLTVTNRSDLSDTGDPLQTLNSNTLLSRLPRFRRGLCLEHIGLRNGDY